MRSAHACAAFLLVSVAGCGHAEIPYDLSFVKPAPKPIHARKIALLPFIDARSQADGPDDAERFEYRGVVYAHTQLDRLPGSPFSKVTELVAKHLAATRTFSQVILVMTPDQAPEADLILTGSVRRMRGYVEAEPPSEKSGRPKDERFVLAEVLLGNIQIRDAKHPENILLRMDAGWSVYEPRMTYGAVPDPWQILSEALFKAVGDMVTELGAADLSGAILVRDRVAITEATPAPAEPHFGALEKSPPEGWRATSTSTAAKPVGWKSEPKCSELRLEQLQTRKFHRVLGSYRPAVTIWACPKALHLKYDAREEFPARYLGEREGGGRYFLLTLGESNWPNVEQEIRAHLVIAAPPKRHIFELSGTGSAP